MPVLLRRPLTLHQQSVPVWLLDVQLPLVFAQALRLVLLAMQPPSLAVLRALQVLADVRVLLCVYGALPV